MESCASFTGASDFHNRATEWRWNQSRDFSDLQQNLNNLFTIGTESHSITKTGDIFYGMRNEILLVNTGE